MLEKRILPAIGHLRLDKIKPMTINRLINDIAESPRFDGKPGKISDMTFKHHYMCISGILQDAVEWDVIPENPCRRVKPPKVEYGQGHCYNEEQAVALLEALEGESFKHRTLVYLTISSGAREGEIMGLEWKHIDFDNNTITITQSSQYLPQKGIFIKTQKTKPVFAPFPCRVTQCPSYVNTEKNSLSIKLNLEIFGRAVTRFSQPGTASPGYPWWPGSWFKKFLKKNGLPHVPFHSLRHLSATLLIKEGVPLKNVSKRLEEVH